MSAAAKSRRVLSTAPSSDCRIGAIDGVTAVFATRLGVPQEQTVLSLRTFLPVTQANLYAG
jgi:hypothetical protein